MGTWTIYNKDGLSKVQIHSLEYQGTWMGECYLSVTVKSPIPINFEIGDYIDYRDERFTINYSPSIKKIARRNSYGEAFIYENIKFNASSDELTRADFCDFVLYGSNIHYSSLPIFSFYAESVKDLCDRLLANLNRYYTGEKQWTIKILTSQLDEKGNNIWYTVGSDETFSHSDFGGEKNVYVSVDNIMCWDAATYIKEKFKLNFFYRGRTLYIGTMGQITPIFRYGKGNGLRELERVADSSQQIITRLKAYGSDRNMPIRYYTNINVRTFAKVTRIFGKYTSAAPFIEFHIDLAFLNRYFNNRSVTHPGTDEYPCYIIRMTANGVTVKGYVSFNNPSNYENLGVSGCCRVYAEVSGYGILKHDGKLVPYNFENEYEYNQYNDDRDEPDWDTMKAFADALKEGDTVYFVEGVNEDKFPKENREYITDNLPNNMAIQRLMLPGFPTISLKEWAEQNEDWFEREGIDVSKYIFSEDPLEPWVQSKNADEIGILPGTVMFDRDDADNGIVEIYPSIEGLTSSDIGIGGDNKKLDEVEDAEIITDNGIFEEKTTVPNFYITLPYLGFDLRKYLESDTTISMKNGMCGAREFQVVGITQNDDLTFTCTCQRSHDETLDIYFPYDATQGYSFEGKQPYQIYKGDGYVIINIELPKTYISAASRRLLRYTIAYLDANCYTRNTYTPSIDNIFMQRQHDNSVADTSGTIISLHDTIKEGDIFAFSDNDLAIDGNVVIDQLTINENENSIPTYEVVLRDDKTVGTIQKIQNQIQSISSALAGGGSTGYNSEQIKSLIRNYGADYFLSKVSPDAAAELITFLKGLQVGADGNYYIGQDGVARLLQLYAQGFRSHEFVSGLDGKGMALVVGEDGKTYLEVDNILVRGSVIVQQLEVKQQRYTAGNQSFGCAGNRIARVVPVTAQGEMNVTLFYVPVIENGEVTGYTVIALDAEGKLIADTQARVKEITTDVIAYKCYFLIDDDTKQITNDWHIGDMAKCTEWNLKAGAYTNVGNRYYWRLVTDVSTEPVTLEDNKKYGWVVLSNKEEEIYDNSLGFFIADISESPSNDFNVIFGYDQNPVNLSGTVVTNSVPAAGDYIVQQGNPIDEARQGLITLNVSDFERGKNGIPSFNMYRGIGSDTSSPATQYNLGDHRPIHISPESVDILADNIRLRTSNPYDNTGTTPIAINKGEWTEGTTAAYYEQYIYEGCTWLCIAPNGTSDTPSIDNNDVWAMVSGTATYDIEVTKWGFDYSQDDDMFAITYEAHVYRTIGGVREKYIPQRISPAKFKSCLKVGFDTSDLQESNIRTKAKVRPGTVPLYTFSAYVDDEAFSACDLGDFAEVPTHFIMQALDNSGNGNILATVRIPLSFTKDGKAGQGFEVKGSAIGLFNGDSADASDWLESLHEAGTITLAKGDQFIINESDTYSRGSVLYVYDPDYTDTLMWHWREAAEVPVGDAYIINRKDGFTDLEEQEGHLFVATEEDISALYQWWQDLGKIQGADGKDGIAFYFTPSVVILEETLSFDNTGKPLTTAIASQTAQLRFNRGGNDGIVVIDGLVGTEGTVLSLTKDGFVLSVSNNTITVGYQDGDGTLTETTVTVRGHISVNGSTIETIQVLSLKINRLGAAELRLHRGIAQLLVNGKFYDVNGEAHTFESALSLSKDSGLIGKIVDGILAAGIDIDWSNPSNTIMRLIAETVKIQTSDGELIALFGYDAETGKAYLNTTLINVDELNAGRIWARIAELEELDAQNATIKNLTVENAKVIGTLASPFVNDESYIIDLDGNQTWHDNIFIESTGGWQYGYQLPWTAEHSGRTLWVIERKGSSVVKYTAESGKYFFENGVRRTEIKISKQLVQLKGYGTADEFYGWIVVSRTDVEPAYSYGTPLKALAVGRVISTYADGATGTVGFGYCKTFDCSTMYVSRTRQGVYVLSLPSTWNIKDVSSLLVQVTGFGGQNSNANITNITASVHGIVRSDAGIEIEIYTWNEYSKKNDGSFMFSIYNMADWEGI